MAHSKSVAPSVTVYFAHSEAYDPGQLHVGTKALGAGKPTGAQSMMMTCTVVELATLTAHPWASRLRYRHRISCLAVREDSSRT